MKPRREAPRDQSESGFTPVLRSVFRADPRILALVFVDREGETVDYCSALGSFDTKIAGAELLVVMENATERLRRCGFGMPYDVAIEADERSFLLRRIDDAYVLVVVLTKGPITESLRHIVARTAAAFRREAGLSRPRFEFSEPQLQVEVRPAVNWPYAPRAFRRRSGAAWESVSVVLGRSVDRDAGLVWFRLRTDDGAELTVAHDEEIDRWVAVDDGTYGDAINDVQAVSAGGEEKQASSAPREPQPHENE